MGPKLSNVVDFYIHGVRDGHLSAAIDKYVGDGLIEHSPGIRDGRDGLFRAYEHLVDRHYRRQVFPLRGFEDGSLVFLHTFSTFGWREIEQVTLDIFDTDADDHIIEHWGVTAPLSGRTASGASQVDGSRWVGDAELTSVNKEIVRRYVQRCLIGGGDVTPYVGACLEHDPEPVGPAGYRSLRQLAGSGDFVATAGQYADRTGTLRTAGDLFRVEGGRIVEHWAVRES
jgi:predicted SnoaL-like aldol condensation-catalyzing enzyme